MPGGGRKTSLDFHSRWDGDVGGQVSLVHIPASFPFTLIINCLDINRSEHFARKLSVRCPFIAAAAAEKQQKRKKLNDLREISPGWLSTNRNFFRYFFRRYTKFFLKTFIEQTSSAFSAEKKKAKEMESSLKRYSLTSHYDNVSVKPDCGQNYNAWKRF